MTINKILDKSQKADRITRSEREIDILSMYGEDPFDHIESENDELIFGFVFYDDEGNPIPKQNLTDDVIIEYYDKEGEL